MRPKVKCRIELETASHTVPKERWDLRRIGIWENDEGICRRVAENLSALKRTADVLLPARHPAELAMWPLELLVVSPGATGWAGAEALSCRMVLVPGSAGPLVRSFQAGCAVSYGASPRDTITISSMEGTQLCVAIQRELVTVDGGVLERQELVLPCRPEWSPLPYLAAVGTQLLLGVPTEEIR
jgi:hypothetical protein